MAALYGIMDAAQDERLYDWIVSEPEYACLFAGRLDPVLARAAPYVVHLPKYSRLLSAWETEGRGRNWGIQCTSDASIADLRRHLRRFLQAQLPDGSTVFFRFYDPRVWQVYLTSCNADELREWFDPIQRFYADSKTAGLLSYQMAEGELVVERR